MRMSYLRRKEPLNSRKSWNRRYVVCRANPRAGGVATLLHLLMRDFILLRDHNILTNLDYSSYKLILWDTVLLKDLLYFSFPFRFFFDRKKKLSAWSRQLIKYYSIQCWVTHICSWCNKISLQCLTTMTSSENNP